MKPSSYQQTILDWLENGSGNVTVNAVAGSGKTTTLKLAAEKLRSLGLAPKDIKVIVFGKQNSIDMITKFGREWKLAIQTLHSVGFKVLQEEIGKFRRDEKIFRGKYKKIAEDRWLIPKIIKRKKYKGALIESGSISKPAEFLKLIDLARLTLSDLSIDSLRQICSHHALEGIYNFKRVRNEIYQILIQGQEQAIDQHLIDFTDMIWLPVEWELHQKSWFKTYKWVLTDECQDLNAAQLQLSLMLAGNKGRMLYVGDPRQAIYGFSGADNESYQKIIDRTKATELPLSLCYRCPKSHIDLVNSIYPEIPIKAYPSAVPGILECIESSALWDEEKHSHLKIGDLVLSRKTAPLVALCIRLIGKGIAATVKGKDIGKQIKSELEAIADINGFRYKDFNYFSEKYKLFKFQTYEGLDNAEQMKENLSDRLEALSTIYSSQPNATCIADLCTYIDDLFSDDESPITLSTCHRAKGLEGERIFIIKPKDMPMVWERQKKWQKEQENNLLYVALTRSKSELYIVGNPDWFQVKEKESGSGRSQRVANFSDDLDKGVNSLQKESSIAQVLMMISGLGFKDKCELHKLFTDQLNQEKRNMVTIALQQDSARSDRAIAAESGTSAPFVSKIRKQLEASQEINVSLERVDLRGGKQNLS